MKRRQSLFAAAIAMALVAASILIFGAIQLVKPISGDPQIWRSVAVAQIGMGLFGCAVAWFGLRRGQRWAWWTLTYLPLFWLAHLVLGLPPGRDHVHQVIAILASTAALAISFAPTHASSSYVDEEG